MGVYMYMYIINRDLGFLVLRLRHTGNFALPVRLRCNQSHDVHLLISVCSVGSFVCGSLGRFRECLSFGVSKSGFELSCSSAAAPAAAPAFIIRSSTVEAFRTNHLLVPRGLVGQYR